MKDTSTLSSKWEDRFLDLAGHIATWSKDPSTKLGAVAVEPDTRRILATGYNGFPRGIKDSFFRLNDRSLKYPRIVHAEMNCIYNATHSGVSLKGADLYINGLPLCSDCAKGVIQVGIKRVFMCHPAEISDKWSDSFKTTAEMLDEAGIQWKIKLS